MATRIGSGRSGHASITPARRGSAGSIAGESPCTSPGVDSPCSQVLVVSVGCGRGFPLPKLTTVDTSTDESKTCDGDPATLTSSHDSSGGNPRLEADLRRLIAAWPTLPEPLRAGIMAMVRAASDEPDE